MKRAIWFATLILFLPASALAQQLRVHGGFSTHPTFVWGGFQVGVIPKKNPVGGFVAIDIAGGWQRALLVTFGMMIAPKRENSAWKPYVGIAPTFLIASDRSENPKRDGFAGGAWGVMIGVEHQSRLTFELQINLARSEIPLAYFSIGYRLF